METSNTFELPSVKRGGPYPTYEEWKPSSKSSSFLLINNRPYPTYEEWKHLFFDNFELFFHCPYPTYEEWKRTIYF